MITHNLYAYGANLDFIDFDFLAKELNCIFSICKTKKPRWVRIFVLSKDNVNIGKITVEDGKVYHFKHYKPDYIDTLDEEDKIYLRLDSLLKTGSMIPSTIYDQFVIDAKIIADKDLEEKKAWRAANPPVRKNNRKALKRRSERWLVTSMVRDWCNQQIQEMVAEEAEDDWHERMNDMYTYAEDGFCDGFTKY